jgi:putative transposase
MARLWLDATYLRQREGGRIVSVAVIIAVACDAEGRRVIVGLHIGPSEAETFWATFLKSLVKRGLHGVKLVVSDAHEGLKAAMARVLGATWQRCRVGLLKNSSQADANPVLARLARGAISTSAMRATASA